ncbi:MAG: PKD domain-containing protein [Candidatus Brocadiales bacterium]|nr:PKD domain-containing protein [Candidatus Brocadiales bacterium]
MSNITNQELSLLRSRPHSTKLWLSIYQPTTVLACQVNDASIAHEEREVTYNNVTSGAFGDVKSGMTMFVGTTPGARDKGRIRVRSATSSVITVAENSHINWEDDLYLTIINFFEIWPIFPYYTLEGGLVSWFKDYDVGYVSQNSDFGQLICAGPHRAAFVNDNIYYSATGTVDVKDRGMSYLWDFDGGTPTGSVSETPGNVTYDTPGHYTTSLTVTADGISDVTYRHISIYNRPDEGSNPPILRWEMDDLSGSRDEGGYTCRFRVHENVSSIVDGALVVLFADDIYDETSQSIGGNYPNNEKIVFVGYVAEGSIEYNSENSFVEFDVVSATEIMKAEEGPIVSLESASSPSDWYEIEDMDIQKFLYHYLRWHSTVLFTSDFRYLNDDFVFQYQDTDPASLYDVINNFMFNSLRGSLVADRQGLMWAEIGVEAINNVTGSVSVGMEIFKQDWMGEPFLQEIEQSPLSYIEMGGVAWSGASSGTFEAYLAGAPGNTHGYYGSSEDHQGLILTSQGQLNTLVGNVFAYQNAQYPNVIFEFTGNYRNLDIAPQEIQKLQIFPNDTQRGITFLGKEFHITDISWKYDPSTEIFIPVVNLREITQGFNGITVKIPGTPEVPETPLENIPEIPTIFFPEFPPFPTIPIPSIDIPPIMWISLPQTCDIVTACANLSGEVNISALHVSGEIRSDGESRTLFGWLSGAVLRSAAHINTTYVGIDGIFEKSSDYGVTWEELDDDSVWHIYAFSNYGTGTASIAEFAPIVMDYTNGRARKFSLVGCRDLGPGGGFQLSLDSCATSGEATVESNEICEGFSFGTAIAANEWFVGDLGVYFNGSETNCQGSGFRIRRNFIWKITDAPDLPVGSLRVKIKGIYYYSSGDMDAEILENNDTCDVGSVPDIGGIAADHFPAVGEVITSSVYGAGPHAGGTYYFGTRININRSGCGGAYYEATTSFEIVEIKWIVQADSSEIDLFAQCQEITRIQVNEMYVHNLC